ncbi:MAG: enoyl-CoA hydratase-related protein [Pseudomonadota bacterium]
MSYQTISLETDERGVATVTLDREPKHNVMDERMLDELTRVAVALSSETSVRVVVLTGRGSSFCAGADLGWMKANLELDIEERLFQSNKLGEMLNAWNDLSKLVIAKVNGQAFGGGVGIICTCDIVIGVDTAVFSLSEVKLGLAPANISPFVLQRLGRRVSRRLLLNAHRFNGPEAARFGLLDECVSTSELSDCVEGEITELLTCGPEAVARTKELIRFVSTHSDTESREYGAKLLADVWQGDESDEGIRAFFERRKPSWSV